jgi:hypothetical protein
VVHPCPLLLAGKVVPGRYQGLARHSASVPEAEAWQVARLLKEQPLQPGIVHALDAKRILRYPRLGRSRNVIDRPEACGGEQQDERYSDHFRTIFAVGVVFSGALGIDSAGTSQRGH